MKRYLCWLAVLAVAAIPDWASAYHPCGWPPPPCGYPVGPGYYPPVVYVPVYPPAAPPRVHVSPAAAPARPAQPATPQAASPAPAPKSGGSDEKIPPLKLPGMEEPKAPPVPSAVPSPAPPPDTGAIAPPKAPAAKPPLDPGSLPRLTLPMEGPSTSRASPLAAAPRSGPKVSIFPAASTAATAAATRKVGFFNHTVADLELVIEGKAVKLPRKTYLHAEVPPTFTWKHGAGSPQTATVPEGAAGLDVVFRDE